MVDAMNAYLGLPASGLAGMLAPTGSHPGGEHHPRRCDEARRPTRARPDAGDAAARPMEA